MLKTHGDWIDLLRANGEAPSEEEVYRWSKRLMKSRLKATAVAAKSTYVDWAVALQSLWVSSALRFRPRGRGVFRRPGRA